MYDIDIAELGCGCNMYDIVIGKLGAGWNMYDIAIGLLGLNTLTKRVYYKLLGNQCNSLLMW